MGKYLLQLRRNHKTIGLCLHQEERTSLMGQTPIVGGVEASIPSLSVLRSPLPDTGWTDFSSRQGRDLSADLLEYLKQATGNGGKGAEEEVAEALAYALIFQTLTSRMLDAKKGRVPRFIDRMAKSVRSFERQLG